MKKLCLTMVIGGALVVMPALAQEEAPKDEKELPRGRNLLVW